MSDWTIEQLGEHIAHVESGTRPKGGVAMYIEGIPSLSAEHIQADGAFSFEALRYVPREFYQNASRGKIRLYDILVVKDGATTGKSAIIEDSFPFKEAMVNEHTFILRTKPSLVPKFCYYALRSGFAFDCFNDARQKGVIGSLNQAFVDKIKIPIPSLDEQRRIVTRIEELTCRVEEARKLRQEAVEKINHLFQTELERIFLPTETDNWTEYGGHDVFGIVKGQVDPREEPYASMLHIAPDVIEIGTGRLVAGKIKTAAKLELKSGKYLFNASHVLYSKIRPNLRKVAMPDFEGTCSADIYPMIPNTEVVTREFLALVLLSLPFTTYAVENSDRNAMPKVNRPTMFGFKVKLPGLAEQMVIVDRIRAQQDKAEEISKLQLSADEELRNFQSALLAKAFRGEL